MTDTKSLSLAMIQDYLSIGTKFYYIFKDQLNIKEEWIVKFAFMTRI